jgi:hypothetical protein
MTGFVADYAGGEVTSDPEELEASVDTQNRPVVDT